MQNFREMKFDILSKETMNQDNPIIVFVCEHGAAKSVIAAAYFNKLAQEANSEVRAVARGTHPDSELSPKAVVACALMDLLPQNWPRKNYRWQM